MFHERSTHSTRRRPFLPARILVVEDVADQAYFSTTYLKHAGYDVTIAPNGPEAINLLADNAFDLDVLDLNLPMGSGLVVLSFARRILHSKTPVVVTTAVAAGWDKKIQCEAYLTKPFSPKDLIKAVHDALTASRISLEGDQP